MEHTYAAVVFLKNCLVRSVQKCDEFEISPFSGIGLTDELALLQDYLVQRGFEPLKGADQLSDAMKSEQPTTVVRFPALTASSPGECITAAVRNAEVLSEILALQRLSYGTVIAAIVIDSVAGRYWWWVKKPIYTGNLLGGFLAGEQTALTRERFAKVRMNDSLRLFMKLYRDAIEEQDTEMAYYRYWSVLELIARTKGIGRSQKLDRNGTAMLNRNGAPHLVTDQAEALVTELLRRVHVARNVSQALGLGHLFDLVPIWYRHRNCIVHAGGCRPEDPAHCHRHKEQFVRCRDMHCRVVERSGTPRGRHADELLRALEGAVGLVVIQELADSDAVM
jgi:hypothetical protein